MWSEITAVTNSSFLNTVCTVVGYTRFLVKVFGNTPSQDEHKGSFCMKAEYWDRQRGGRGIFRSCDRQIKVRTYCWHSAGMLRDRAHCICTVNVSCKHAEVHSRPSLSLMKWVTCVWADFYVGQRSNRLHSGPQKIHFTDQWLMATELTGERSLPFSLQAAQLKWDSSLKWRETTLMRYDYFDMRWQFMLV